ncbi:ATP-dependent 6-phosphofructokinase 1 [Mesoterricola sediminis]|uniref:6-phosphofructokinase n=2 Tax=Mesoterricola sediminis TaxID=2927980 RepID=A0AA48KBE3_9BACT|nr:ATP-dependent 6-phosphofructokinase 1 [Mesoterricola sediminis]
MNAAIRAAVRQADALGMDVYGVYRGYQGLVEQDWRPLTSRHCANILQRGGTILNTARCDAWRLPAVRAKAAQDLKDAGVDALVVIGGDGSFTGAEILNREHGIPCAGIPGTIDNDLPGTDRTLGFDTALNTAVQAIDRIRDTASAHERLFLVEVMGRSSGMIAVNTAIACGAEAVLYPEAEEHGYQALVTQLRAGWERGKRSSIVVVAEGDASGGAYKISELLRKDHNLDMRVVVLGHIQRGGSPTAIDRIWGSRWGAEAVKRLAAGETSFYLGSENGELVSRPLARIHDPKPNPPKELAILAGVLAR